MIGVLGGMGPQAGFDLASLLTAETAASSDQDHLPVVVWSDPRVPDRTAWLDDNASPDPAPAIAEGFLALERAGAGVAGLACNTAHTPAIFDRVEEHLRHAGARVRILHLIRETVTGIREWYPGISTVGVLGTHGTLVSRQYHRALDHADLTAISPDNSHRLTEAIYHPETGIKTCSSPVAPQAREAIFKAIEDLADQGSEAVILGCTELPLAVPERTHAGVHLINPARMLARALIRSTAPDRLRP
ncbi:MAG: amino acid racemase [Bacteroidota bacterium]|nr:amino acid racemase [Bacteroidota bacterium]